MTARMLAAIAMFVGASIPVDLARSAQMVAHENGTNLTRFCRAFIVLTRQGGKGTAQQAYEAGLCQGLVVGVLDAISIENFRTSVGPELCVPSGVDQNAATEIVAKYLDANPAERNNAAYTLVRRAIAASFPCHEPK